MVKEDGSTADAAEPRVGSPLTGPPRELRPQHRSALALALANPALRRIGVAYGLSFATEFGIWLALLVFAYAHGGPTGALLMVIVQLLPSVALAPFIGAATDRHGAGPALRVGYGLQALAIALTALTVLLAAPTLLVYLLAPLTALPLTVVRPAQSALLPASVRTPEELTAANVISGWSEGVGGLLGPAAVGTLIAWHGLGVAIAVCAAASAPGVLLVARLGAGNTLLAVGESSLGSLVRASLAATWRHPTMRVLLGLRVYYYVLVGSLDLLCVILAVSVLHLGQSGAGYLNGALGAGALASGLLTALLLGRRHLSIVLAVSILVTALALLLLGLVPNAAVAFLLLALVGLTGSVFDLTGRMLLQRAAPADSLAGAFAIFEGLSDAGLLLGALLVRLSIAVGGVRAAVLVPAAAGLLLLVALWRRLRAIDRQAVVPQVEIRLLRALAIFSSLPALALEGVARDLTRVDVNAGSVVIREGDPGDRYFAIADGQLEVSQQGHRLATLTRGEGFGEIALVRDVPRTATVTATTPATLYSLDKSALVLVLTGHAPAARRADQVVDLHLASSRQRGPTE